MLTATVIQENLESPENIKLAPFNEYLRTLAKEKKLPLADLNALFQERIKVEGQPGTRVLTGDGVHMNAAGNQLMAIGVLMAFGLDSTQMDKAQKAWYEQGLKDAAQQAEKVQQSAEAQARKEGERKAKADAEGKAKQEEAERAAAPK
jgi:hypothetical protein